MSTVRFSNSLKSDITRNAKGVFRGRIQTAEENTPDWGMNVYDLIFKDTKAQMLAMPEGFFSLSTRLSVNSIPGLFEGNQHSIEVDLPNEMPFPNRLSPVSMGLAENGRTYGGYELNKEDTRWVPILTEFRAYSEGINDVKAKQSEFVDGVRKVITAYSTLAPALKAWPPLWDLLDDDVKERHKKITERANTERDLGDVDLNKLTSTVVAGRITR